MLAIVCYFLQVDRANAVIEQLGQQVMGLMIIGDEKKITSPNGMTMGLMMWVWDSSMRMGLEKYWCFGQIRQ